jgi:hypothetical protein
MASMKVQDDNAHSPHFESPKVLVNGQLFPGSTGMETLGPRCPIGFSRMLWAAAIKELNIGHVWRTIGDA